MEKIKSYLGLLLAVSFCLLFFWPQKKSFFHHELGATMLDMTGPSSAIQSADNFRLMKKVFVFNKQCRGGVDENDHRCRIGVLYPSLDDLVNLSNTFEKHDPGFKEALSTYIRYGSSDDYDAIALRAINSYPKVIEELIEFYIFIVYLTHAALAGLVGLMFFFRRELGGAAIWPVMAASRGLRYLHGKV